MFDCAEEWSYVEIEEDGNLFRCYQFNNESEFTTSLTGYQGAMQLEFKVPLTGVTDYTARYAAQVTFSGEHEQPELFTETNFAPVGYSTLYEFQNVVNRDRNKVEYRQFWAQTSSLISLPLGTEFGTVGVSFGYSVLNTQNVDDIVTRTPNTFVGEVAGMLGFLMGVDVHKVLFSFIAIPVSIYRKELDLLWEVYEL
jgi:hypothetical protein